MCAPASHRRVFVDRVDFAFIPMSIDSDDHESDSEPPTQYSFSSPEGHQLARRILRPQLPYDPHDYQLEGICKAVDGVDIMVLTPTGSGKTGYYIMYMRQKFEV